MPTSQSDKEQKGWQFLMEKILSWQVFALLVFFILLGPIKGLLEKAEQIKVGDFQMTVTRIAENLGVSNVIEDLEDLSYDELKIFLVIGGEDADYYTFAPNNLPAGKTKNIFENLSQKGLIKLIEVSTMEGITREQREKGIGFKTTEKGEKIHRAIVDAIYRDLIQNRVSNLQSKPK